MKRDIIHRGFNERPEGPARAFYNGTWHDGEWLYGYYADNMAWGCDFPCIMPLKTSTNLIGFDSWRVAPETVGEFSGFSDKNGNNIYEGHVIRAMGEEYLTAEIIFSEGCFKLKWLGTFTANIRQRKTEPMFSNTSLIFEIIGSIFDTEVGV